MKDVVLREKAATLRREGYSYSYISQKLALSKSTLSGWLAKVPYTPNKETLDKIGNSRAASGLAKHKMKLASFVLASQQARKDIGRLSDRDVFMLGIGMYTGEGTKDGNSIRLVNANPDIIRFAICWFQRACALKPGNFRVRLHLYPDTDASESLSFWSNALHLPKSQFYPPCIDLRQDKRRMKKGKLPYGTAHLSIKSNGKKAFGVALARRINAWIELVLKNAGMV